MSLKKHVEDSSLPAEYHDSCEEKLAKLCLGEEDLSGNEIWEPQHLITFTLISNQLKQKLIGGAVIITSV